MFVCKMLQVGHGMGGAIDLDDAVELAMTVRPPRGPVCEGLVSALVRLWGEDQLARTMDTHSIVALRIRIRIRIDTPQRFIKVWTHRGRAVPRTKNTS